MIKLSFKGQSAIEYLMTYGWMLLVVAIVGGAIFAVTGENSIESKSGFAGGDITVENFGVSENSLDFVLRNSAAKEVKINSIKVTDPSTGINTEIRPEKTISVADNTKVDILGVEETEGSKSLDVKVNYDVGGLENLTLSGKVSGSLDVFNRMELASLYPNESSNEFNFEVGNTGSDPTGSIQYSVISESNQYDGQISSLDRGQSTQVTQSVANLSKIRSLELNADGFKFAKRDYNIQCSVQNDPVAYWDLDEEVSGNGGTAQDSTSNDIDGTYEGGVNTSAEGVFNSSAAEFDGVDDQVRVPHDNLLNIGNTDQLSISAWFKTNEINGNFKGIVIKNRDDTFGSWYGMWALNGKTPVRTGTMGGNAGEYGSAQSWNHLVMVVNKQNGTRRTYLNGEQALKTNISSANIFDRSSPLRIGSSYSGFEDMNGSVDEVRIFNRTLSSSEVEGLENRNTPSYCEIE